MREFHSIGYRGAAVRWLAGVAFVFGLAGCDGDGEAGVDGGAPAAAADGGFGEAEVDGGGGADAALRTTDADGAPRADDGGAGDAEPGECSPDDACPDPLEWCDEGRCVPMGPVVERCTAGGPLDGITLCIPDVHLPRGYAAHVPIFLLQPRPVGFHMGRIFFTLSAPDLDFGGDMDRGPLLEGARFVRFAPRDGKFWFQEPDPAAINVSGVLVSLSIEASRFGDSTAAELSARDIDLTAGDGSVPPITVLPGTIHIHD